MKITKKTFRFLQQFTGSLLLVMEIIAGASPAHAAGLEGRGNYFAPPNILVDLTNDANEDYSYSDLEFANSPGQIVEYLVRIENNIAEAAVIDAVIDDRYTDLGTCEDLVGTTLAGYSSMQCKFKGRLPGGEVDITHSVIVRVSNKSGESSSASDSTRVLYNEEGVLATATLAPKPTQKTTTLPTKTAQPTATLTPVTIMPSATASNTPTAAATHTPQPVIQHTAAAANTTGPADGSTAGRVAEILTATAQAGGEQPKSTVNEEGINAGKILIACLGGIVLLLITGVVFELVRWKNARQEN